MTIIEDPSNFRTNIRNNLELIFNPELNNKHIYSSDLEKGVFNWSVYEASSKKILKKWTNKYFVQIYIDRLRTIYCNLKQNNSVSNDVINGHIRPHVFAFMTHQEMMMEKWNEFIQRKIKRDERIYETDISAATDTFVCRKCKSNKCTFYQMQTRSADEPMTTFVTCLTCDNRWKC